MLPFFVVPFLFIRMSEQNTTFLSNKVDEVNPGNIFQELEEELSVTPEGEEKDKKSSHPLALAARIIEVVFGITLFFTIILSIDSGVRNNITDQIE